MNSIELFVPGRLCIIGEHSDWAGLHKIMNSGIIPGMAIVTGVEQGIYAYAERAEKFIVESDLEIYNSERFVCEMDTQKLLNAASSGGFFSYVAGVASYMCENYHVKGLRIKITAMDLPIKSGLSSSAAICVLVARAFNKLYNLHLNNMGEMRIAFLGEQRTPSRCGRLDQACAYGVKPVKMIFDGEDIHVSEIKLKKEINFVIAELNSSKDTIRILTDLNKCYPFADNDISRNVHRALGEDNRRFIEEAAEAMESGDIPRLGAVMNEFQANFDKKVAPACPSELTAPVLHSVMNDETILKYSYGVKGVGSQGDGTVQILAKNRDYQQMIIKYLKEQRNMRSFSLTLSSTQEIHKAIIPAAGFGTRLFPASKVFRKEFMPVIDSDGMLKPAIMLLLEQLAMSGIDEICLVINEADRALYDSFFSGISDEYYSKLSSDKQACEDKICSLGERVTYVYQHERLGFGHAVYQCRGFANAEPVLLLLGDMVYKTRNELTCSKQIINAFGACGQPVISLHEVPLDKVENYGIVSGEWLNDNETMMRINAICEKPSPEYAERNLTVQTRSGKKYFSVFGQYILTEEVFRQLERSIADNAYSSNEIQLTDALEAVMKKSGMTAFVPDGVSYDLGLPCEYVNTVKSFAEYVR